MVDVLPNGVSLLLDGLPPPLAKQAAETLAPSASIEIKPGEPHFRTSFPTAALLVVEEGPSDAQETTATGLVSAARRFLPPECHRRREHMFARLDPLRGLTAMARVGARQRRRDRRRPSRLAEATLQRQTGRALAGRQLTTICPASG